MRSLILTLLLILSSSLLFAQIRQSKTFSEKNTEISYAQPREYEIGGIRVVGRKILDPNTLISLTGLKVGDRVSIPGQEITDAIKKLWKHGLVDNLAVYQEKIEDGKIYLIIELIERPRLRKFTFSGLNKTDEKEIGESISLYRGKILTEAIIKNTQSTVKKYFKEKGYLYVNVKISQIRDTVLQNHVIVHVDVDKRSKVKIYEIFISGSNEIPNNKLKKKLKKTGELIRFTLFNELAN